MNRTRKPVRPLEPLCGTDRNQNRHQEVPIPKHSMYIGVVGGSFWGGSPMAVVATQIRCWSLTTVPPPPPTRSRVLPGPTLPPCRPGTLGWTLHPLPVRDAPPWGDRVGGTASQVLLVCEFLGAYVSSVIFRITHRLELMLAGGEGDGGRNELTRRCQGAVKMPWNDGFRGGCSF